MNIVVSGCSRGIGKEICKALIGKGHFIYALSKSENPFPGNSRLEFLKEDWTTETGRNALLSAIENKNEPIDALINNAAVLVNKPFEHITSEELLQTFEVNVFSPFLLTQLLLPFLRKSKHAHVVNIGSMGGVQGTAKFQGLSAYSSSKGALAILSEMLAEELKNDNIAVNCLALGAVQTEMLEAAFPGYKAPITAEAMAKYIVDFCLKGHELFNGKIIPVSLSTP